MDNKRKSHKQHTVYKNADGKRVPGTTTITGVMNKPALMYWANNIGLEGVKVREYVDTLAGIGTLTHKRIECELTDAPCDMDEYSADDIEASDNSMLSWWEWLKGHEIENVHSELKLVSEKYQYGGMLDIVCELDGVTTLIDLKTGKAIYPDHILQLAAYYWLTVECGLSVKQVYILNIPRAESEGFEMKHLPISVLQEYFDEIFLHCRAIYQGKMKVGWK